MKCIKIGVAAFLTWTISLNVSAQVRKSVNEKEFSILKYNNPGLLVDLGVGLWAWPLPIDFDRDGDMDLLVSSLGAAYNGIYYFENLTGGDNPVFAAAKKIVDTAAQIQVSYVNNKPYFMLPGKKVSDIDAAGLKKITEVYPVNKLYTNMEKPPFFQQWKMVDWEGDGTLDILAAYDDWNDYGWDNAFDSLGNWTKGPLHGYVCLLQYDGKKYVNKGMVKAGGKAIDLFGVPFPSYADFDGDGDLDLICGEFLDKFTWFENKGTRAAPEFATGRFLKNDSGVIQMDLQFITPTAVDWNSDGFTDLVVGQEDGRVALLKNTGRQRDGMPLFEQPLYFKQEADIVKFGALATPFSVDWDEDGDEDLIVGNTAGYIGFIENLGGDPPRWSAPVYLEANNQRIRIVAGNNGSIQGPAEAKWGYTSLSVADWDGDGLKDIIVNSILGEVIWFKNKGKKGKPLLAAAQSVTVGDKNSIAPRPRWNWKKSGLDNRLITQWRTTPFATDWNNDGLMDLIMLDQEGYLCFFKRSKAPESSLEPGLRLFYSRDESVFDHRHTTVSYSTGLLQLNMGINGASGRRKFTIVDWDQDGKDDILVNSANVSLLKQIQSDSAGYWFVNKGVVAKEILGRHDTSPTIVDWDKNGIPDLLVGAEDGHFYYLRNPKAGYSAP